jgi:hypothetical protein
MSNSLGKSIFCKPRSHSHEHADPSSKWILLSFADNSLRVFAENPHRQRIREYAALLYHLMGSTVAGCRQSRSARLSRLHLYHKLKRALVDVSKLLLKLVNSSIIMLNPLSDRKILAAF